MKILIGISLLIIAYTRSFVIHSKSTYHRHIQTAHYLYKDKNSALPIEDRDSKVTGRKLGLDIENIPVLRRKGRRVSDNYVEHVSTLQDYKAIVTDERVKLVVVYFVASWCRSCKRMKPEFYKLARDLPEEIKFVEVPFTAETAFLCEGLGVPTVPYGHIYHPYAGLVEEQSVSKKNFKKFKLKLKSYIEGSCDINDFEKYVELDSGNLGTPLKTSIGEFE